jgi:NAD(P)-dependent dehydrogenase (short-subunit alcohol dehydrogenase family)
MLCRGNSGIGLETVMELASAGCRVILCSRDVEAGRAAVVHSMHRIDSGTRSPAPVQDIVVLPLDLADLDSVEALVDTVRNTEQRLDFLVLNAGVLATPLGYTKQVAFVAAAASASNDADTSATDSTANRV